MFDEEIIKKHYAPLSQALDGPANVFGKLERYFPPLFFKKKLLYVPNSYILWRNMAASKKESACCFKFIGY